MKNCDCHHTADLPPDLVLGDLSTLGSGWLGQRTGCECGSQSGTDWFAKCLITGPGIVPSTPHGALASFPFLTRCLEQESCPVITASPALPQTRPFSPDRAGGAPPGLWAPPSPLPGAPSDATQGDLMSLGLDPPQMAARGPHPSSPGAFAVDGRRKGNKRGGGWSGLRCLVNPAFSLTLLLSDPATAIRWAWHLLLVA